MRYPSSALLTAAIFLGACSSGPSSALPDPTPVAVAPAAVAPAEPSVAGETTQVAEVPEQAPALPPAAQDRGPTDPATVVLAAGRPQFVEFSAEW